jgi:hypothetical protein
VDGDGTAERLDAVFQPDEPGAPTINPVSFPFFGSASLRISRPTLLEVVRQAMFRIVYVLDMLLGMWT